LTEIFKIPDPNLPIHFDTFGALRIRLSHIVGENSVFQAKIAFFHCYGYKLQYACAISRDLCIEVPQNDTGQFFDPE